MDLSLLNQIWQENNYSIKKRLGQNFLIDKNTIKKIIDNLDFSGSDNCVEIGPGFGSMTFMLRDKCKRLFAIEKDEEIFSIMVKKVQDYPGLNFINEDFLKVNLADYAPQGEKIIVYGNIPYYISTPIIEKLIENRSIVNRAYIVMQEEVADRIVAPGGTRNFSSISCFVQFYTVPVKKFRIKKSCFYPKPKVESALVEFTFLPAPSVQVNNDEIMFRIIRKSFSQRRKKIINPLSDGSIFGFKKTDWEEIFDHAGVDPSSRAEGLLLNDFAKLSDSLQVVKTL